MMYFQACSYEYRVSFTVKCITVDFLKTSTLNVLAIIVLDRRGMYRYRRIL
jgi:hypothetical protein